MGGIGGQSGNKYYDGRSKVAIQRETRAVVKSPLKQNNFNEDSISFRRVYSKLARNKCNKRNYKSNSIALFHSFYETQEKRQKSTNNRLVRSKSTTLHSEVQDGDCSSNSEHDHRGSLGVFGGYKGRVFPCSNQLGLSQVSGVQGKKQSVCVSVPSFRAVTSSLGLHEGHQASETKTSFLVNHYFQLYRRFHSFCEITGRAEESSRSCYKTVAGSGVYHKLGKIKLGTFSRSRIFRSRLESTGSNSIRSGGQKDEYCGMLRQGVEGKLVNKERDGKSGGEVELRIGLHSTREVTSAPYSDLDESALFGFLQGRPGPSGLSIQRSSTSVDGSGVPGEGCTSEAGSSESDLDDGCIAGWLVRGSASSQGCGFLGSGGKASLHELEGDDGSFPVSAEVQVSVGGEEHQATLRQHDDSLLSEETGFGQGAKSTFPSYGDFGVLQGEQHKSPSSSYKGCDECPGGPGIQVPAGRGGMGVGRTNVQVDSNGDTRVASRSVRDKGKCSTPQVRISMSGPESCGLRRISSRLEQMDMHLSFSSNSTTSAGGSDTTGLCGDWRAGGSFLGDSGLVSSVNVEMQDTAFSSTRNSCFESVDFEGFSEHAEQEILEPSRLAVIRGGLNNDCSEDTLGIVDLAHRESTIRQYQAIWRKFLEYLELNNISHDSISLGIVMNFLSHQVIHLKRQYRTIAAYKCALEIPLRAKFGIEFDRFDFHLFMRGVFNHRPPQKSKPIPKWSLNSLLLYLNSDIFEPLLTRSLEIVAKKLLCLILLASGRRISEVGGLSMKHTSFNQGNSLKLYWLDDFRPKHFNAKFIPKDPCIDFIDSDISDELKLCPARAYNLYVNMVNNGARHSVKSPLWKQDKVELTEMFKAVVADSARFANVLLEDSVGPHDMRKFAASYSALLLEANPALERRFIDRMGCASMTVLKRHYIKEVPPLEFKCVLPLGTCLPSTV